ncbi:MAG: SurA N-terminal domain-containing protein [Desulfobulbus sp.]|nr:SurA N-terminal domain-containing protein [Desulfobulbus sp.]
MLNIIRKNAQSLVIQAVVVIIAIVFIFWGVGSKLKNSSNAMAVVNGKEIGYVEFKQSYERAVERYKEQFGGQLPDKFLEGIHLKEQVLDQLVQRELLRQGAETIGIRVSKEATQRKIRTMPVFNQSGQFDLNQYRAVLERNRLSPKTFEGGIHDDLLISRATESVGSFAEMPKAEMGHWLEYIDQEIKLAYAVITSEQYRSQVSVTDEALHTWFEAHKLNYKTAPETKLAYLSFAFADSAKPEAVTEAAMRIYYQEHLAEYQVPERRRARHILIRVDEGASADAKAAKKTEAERLLQQIHQGADFAATAKKFSEDGSKERGGDLGFFSRGQMVPTFERSAFLLNVGEVSPVVESPFGYHIIKLEEVQPEKTRSFAETSQTIRQHLAQKEAQAVAFKEASSTYEDIIRAGSLVKFSEKGGASILHTEFFTQDAPPKMPMANDSAFLQAAFALRKGELSSIVETSSGYVIIFAEDIKAPSIPELTTVRERVVGDYTKEKSVELARASAEAYLKKAKETGNWPEGLEKKESAYVKRIGSANGVPENIRKEAFARLGLGSFPDAVLSEEASFSIYQILDSRTGKSELDGGKRKNLEQQLLAAQKNILLTSWLGQLRKEAKIWINTQMLQ